MKKILYIFLIVLALSLNPTSVLANSHSSLSGPTDPAELEAFLDAFIPAQAEIYQIPGTVVAVVKDGKLLLAKGYGYTDTRSRTPIVVDQTLFHIGSVTKLLTWTAIMQLVEEGKVDLHTDVNTYLPLEARLPDTYPDPITLHHLMTHTPGFEDRLGNLFRFSEDDGVPLSEYVIQQQPERVYPPGEIIGYSNYGAALAGYIIEQVSGMSYETYIEQNILQPLHMTRSSIRQPVPAELRDDLALGHMQTPLGIMPLQEYFPSAPVVGLSATATDMTKFMIAHLQNGRYDDTRILEDSTAQMMHSQQFTQDPHIVGVTYGFVEWQRNGQRILWHGGSTGLFQSTIVLLPEHNLGFFIGCNRKSAREAGKEFRQAFLDHYFPIDQADPDPLPNYKERVQRFTGTYKETRWTYTKADKIVYAFVRTHNVTANPDGTLQFIGSSYIEVEPRIFQEVGGQTTLIFKEDDQGHITQAAYDFDPHKVLLKIKWYETRTFHLTTLALCTIIFVSSLINTTWHTSSNNVMAQQIMRWSSALYLIYLPGAFIISLTTLIPPLPSLAFLAPLLVGMLLLALIASLIFTGLIWRRKPPTYPIWVKIHYTLFPLAMLIFLWWLDYWNLLGLWQF